jgi:hypothetical protein
MSSQSAGLDAQERQALIAQISQQLSEQDDLTLMRVADLTVGRSQNVSAALASNRPLSRRRFFMAALTSGFIATTAGAVAVWEYSEGRSRELGSQLERTQDTLNRVWGLVRLHEKLDGVKLDQTIAAGLLAVGGLLKVLAAAADLVRPGIQAARDAFIRFETAAPTVRAALTWLESQVGDLAQRIQLLEDAIGRALDEVSPATQAIRGFFDFALKLLPTDAGQKVKDVLDRMGGIVTLIPGAIANINVKILTPLRDEWFSDLPGKGLKSWLVEPLNAKLIDPVEVLLGQVAELPKRWDSDLAAPTRAILTQREAIRQEIADYRTSNALRDPQTGS